MKLPDKVYNVLKWITLIAIPALCTCYYGLAQIFALPYGPEVVATGAVVCTCLGTLLGISTAAYNKEDSSNGRTDN